MSNSVFRKRLPWLILAVALMFGSAICGLLYLDAVGKISAWIGLPRYERYVPGLRGYAMLWSGLGLIFPFLAGLLLGLSKVAGPRPAETSYTNVVTGPEVSREWTAVTTILMYLLRVAASALTSLGFMVGFIIVALLLQKLGVGVR
jgi:hypothetical protein